AGLARARRWSTDTSHVVSHAGRAHGASAERLARSERAGRGRVEGRRRALGKAGVAVAEVVERGHAVGLGPQPHRTRTGDMAVLEVDVPLAVERNADALARELDAQRMPCVARHRRI